MYGFHMACIKEMAMQECGEGMQAQGTGSGHRLRVQTQGTGSSCKHEKLARTPLCFPSKELPLQNLPGPLCAATPVLCFPLFASSVCAPYAMYTCDMNPYVVCSRAVCPCTMCLSDSHF